MADPADGTKGVAAAVGEFLWSNRDWIWAKLTEIRSWFRSGNGTKKSPGILILGAGGSGKSTLARILADDNYNPLIDLPGEYEESIGVETYVLADAPSVEIVVPPGQPHRRGATWADLHGDLAAGKFRGVILAASYGHNSFVLSSYKQHRLYTKSKNRFLADYCLAERAEELAILRQLSPHLMARKGKLWMMTTVTKQDLWWPERSEVENHYRNGQYFGEIQRIESQLGATQFRHEVVFASLVIANLVGGVGERLRLNAAGYGQDLQVESLRRLFETTEALRMWEG
jgi:hypothetical protein